MANEHCIMMRVQNNQLCLRAVALSCLFRLPSVPLQILGLNNCADTQVGNALLPGISGGEKKRLTLGE